MQKWLDFLHDVLQRNGFGIVFENIDQVSEEEYAQIRMQGFGASDSSKLLDCNPFPNGSKLDLCKEKATGKVDESIGKKASVRMGKDIEHIILEKAQAILNEKNYWGVVIKPPHMYGNTHHLNINYDGVFISRENPPNPLDPLANYRFAFSIEAKAVTKYGRRYYDFTKSVYYTKDGVPQPEREIPSKYEGPKVLIDKYCIEAAKHYGVPVYYYTQAQQQMMGIGSDGFVAAIDVDNWDVHLFYIHMDEYVQSELTRQGDIAWSIVEIQKEKGESK